MKKNNAKKSDGPQDKPTLSDLKVSPINWSSHLVSFLMLFLAVSLGFMADNFRERSGERSKEREYIRSMIEDAQTDKANIKMALALNQRRIYHLDSLANVCAGYSSDRDDYDIYRHFIYGLQHPNFVSPTERTMQQLKNAGGMRMIQNKTAVDAILIYDDMGKQLADQEEFYEFYQNQSILRSMQLFNYKDFGIGVSSEPDAFFNREPAEFRLLNNNKQVLNEFSNAVLIYEGVVSYYETLLTEMDRHADLLIDVLKKEYDIP